MHEHESKMELGDKDTVASYIHLSKRDMLSARNTSLYACGTYHTRIVQNTCMVQNISTSYVRS